MRSTSSKKLIIVWSVALGLAAVLIGVKYLVNNSFDALAKIQAEIAELQLQKQNLLDLERSLEVTAEARAAATKTFVTKAEVAALLEQVEEIGRVAGATLDVKKITLPDDGVEAPPLAQLSLELAARGTFAQIYHLLLLIENLPAGTKITQWQLSQAATPAAGAANWSAELTVAIDYMNIKNAN